MTASGELERGLHFSFKLDEVSLCIPGSLGTWCVDQSGYRFALIFLSLPLEYWDRKGQGGAFNTRA